MKLFISEKHLQRDIHKVMIEKLTMFFCQVFLFSYNLIFSYSFQIPKNFEKLQFGCKWNFLGYESANNITRTFDLDNFLADNQFMESITFQFNTNGIKNPTLNFLSKIVYSAKCFVHILISQNPNILVSDIPELKVTDTASNIIFLLPSNTKKEVQDKIEKISKILYPIRRVFLFIVNYKNDALQDTQEISMCVSSGCYQTPETSPRRQFHLSTVWIFDRKDDTRDLMLRLNIQPQDLPRLHKFFDNFTNPRFLVLLELQRYLNFTPHYILSLTEETEYFDKNGFKLPAIHTPKTYEFLSLEEKLDPLISYIRYWEEVLNIIYCESNPQYQTPAALSERLFRAFDLATWISLLFVLILCGAVIKTKTPLHDIISILFRQPVSNFKMLHFCLSINLVLVIFIYEADITSKVILLEKPIVFKSVKDMIANSYGLILRTVSLGDGKSVPYNPLAEERLKSLGLFEQNLKNLELLNKQKIEQNSFTSDGSLEDYKNVGNVLKSPSAYLQMVQNNFNFRNKSVDWQCHLVIEPLVENHPYTWSFKRDPDNVLWRETRRMFEHGLIFLWYSSYERAQYLVPSLRFEVLLSREVEALNFSKIMFIYVICAVLFGTCILVFLLEGIRIFKLIKE